MLLLSWDHPATLSTFVSPARIDWRLEGVVAEQLQEDLAKPRHRLEVPVQELRKASALNRVIRGNGTGAEAFHNRRVRIIDLRICEPYPSNAESTLLAGQTL